ncbi:MAG: aerotolerance regulator BatA [Ignavibacteriales bacterium CG_4_9_14_3_um_filter_30_11]|nr:MAG: aerotolerance regulator BatA [Ignavibacteriales bacterium CG_4_9_14_3_um_filter_30_11]
MTFAYPWILYFLAVIPIMVYWYLKKGKNKQPSIFYSSFNIVDSIPKNWKERLIHSPMILRALSLVFLIIALARPQSFTSGQNIYSEGIDIVMDFDISGSMLAQDLKPNRLDAAKNVIENFIKDRTVDRIGLVIFSRYAFTQCPLTIDYKVLTNLLAQVKTGMIEDGTAIGNAIANGVNRLRESKAKSKIIILLTDGMNNAGEVDPMSAAQIAKTFGVRIYTIGVGTRGEAPYPVQTPFGIRTQMVPVNIDEDMLKKIAEETGGEYFRATSTQALKNIYDQIDKLEKTKIEVVSYRNAKEMFGSFLGLGLLFFLLDITLIRSIFRPIP